MCVGTQRTKQSFLICGTSRSVPEELMFRWMDRMDRMATEGDRSPTLPRQRTQNKQSHGKV